MGPLGVILGGSWEAFGPSWGTLGPFWSGLGSLLAALGPSWRGLGSLLAPPGTLGRSKIDQKLDPKLDSKTGRIATEKNGPNATPVVVSELDQG